MENSKKIRISYSKADLYKECPQKYWHRQTHEMRLQASPFAFGSAFESGVTVLLEGGSLDEACSKFEEEWHTRPANRFEEARVIFDNPDMFFYQSDYEPDILSDEDMKRIDEWFKKLLPKVKDDSLKYAESILSKIKANEPISDADRQFTHRVLWLCCFRRGPLMIEAFERDLLPLIEEVVYSQKNIEIESEEGDQVSGIIDFIFKIKGIKGKVIIDLKSAGRFYEEHALDSSDQLGIYAAAEGIENIGYMVVLKKVSFDVRCNKCKHLRENNRLKNCEKCDGGKYTVKSPKIATQLMTKTIEQFRLNDVQHDYSEIITAIKNNISWKNPHSCSNYGTQCEFYDVCWKGKSLDDLPHLKRKK